MTVQNKRNIFATNLQYYMDMSGLSRFDVCKALDINYSTLSKWLSAEKYPRIGALEKLADYFCITLADLVEPKDEKSIKLLRLAEIFNDMTESGQRELLRYAEYIYPDNKKAIPFPISQNKY